MSEAESATGLVITDDGGNYYYLRPEVLEQARMPDEDVQKLKSGMAASYPGADDELSREALDSVAGGAGPSAANLPPISTVNIPQNISRIPQTTPNLPNPGAIRMSTVMCPW